MKDNQTKWLEHVERMEDKQIPKLLFRILKQVKIPRNTREETKKLLLI
jgi:hypothetical protein